MILLYHHWDIIILINKLFYSIGLCIFGITLQNKVLSFDHYFEVLVLKKAFRNIFILKLIWLLCLNNVYNVTQSWGTCHSRSRSYSVCVRTFSFTILLVDDKLKGDLHYQFSQIYSTHHENETKLEKKQYKMTFKLWICLRFLAGIALRRECLWTPNVERYFPGCCAKWFQMLFLKFIFWWDSSHTFWED